ncbi:MAG: tetratricopeptide repeat protein [Candidatus Omnitrophica bacterium]|nr:tetratricopeptide repeat protein [Candidatus Omnitrophota bacterium]
MEPEQKKYVLENADKKSVKEMAEVLHLKEKNIRKFLSKQEHKEAGKKRPFDNPPLDRRSIYLSVILIIVLGFCAYGNSVKGQFLFDDETLVTDNVYITNWSYLPDVFKRDIGAGAGKQSNPYRPFQVLTYMADHSFWKLDPKGYHLTNIVWHILAALSVFWLMNILFADGFLSLLTSLLFVAHPIHTQAVSYIAGRADSLAAVLMLISMVLYIKLNRNKNIGLYLLLAMSYILAVLSRENSLILPLLLLLCHYAFKEKIDYGKFSLIAGLTLGYMILRSVFFRHLMPDTPLHDTTLVQRIPGFFVALTKYIQLLALPLDLHMEYGDRLFPWTDPRAIAGGILFLSLLAVMIRARHRSRLVLFALLWFLVTLIPSSNIYPINAYMAEHWLYLPSIGLFLMASKGLRELSRTFNARIGIIVFCAGLLGFYAFLTIRQNKVYWREPISFYQRTLEFAPESFNASNNLGKLYYALGKKEEAVALFKKAIEINPRYADAYNNLAAAFYEPGKNEEETIRLFQEAVKYNPTHAKAYYNLGKLYGDTGEHEKAALALEKAIWLNPNYVEAYNKLGLIYRITGRQEEAATLLNKALAINPSYAEGYRSLGTLYNDMGMKEESIASLKKAVAIDPDDVIAHTNLAIAYFYHGDTELALWHSQKAKELGGQVPPALLEQLQSMKP